MNEQQLISALQQGQDVAFARLVEMYQVMVFNTALGFVQQVQDAEDIAQEVFIQVHQSIRGFKGDSKLSTWIYRICVTKSLDWKKYHQRGKRIGFIESIFGSKTESVHEISDFYHPGIQLAQKENAAILFSAVNKLPDQQRAAFVLQKLEGLAQSEISQILKLSEGAVESLLQRARQNLKKNLKDYYHLYKHS